MDGKKENELRYEFKQILFELSKSLTLLKNPAERSKFYRRFELLYHSPDGDEFHHFYSDIFIVLTEIKRADGPGGIELLGANIKYIREHYKPLNTDSKGNPINISNHLRKLYDHLSLDMSRISYSDQQDRKISEEDSIKQFHTDLQKSKIDLNKLRADLNTSKQDQQKLKDEVEKVKVDYVAVLGLFSGIVLTFFGGIVFSTSVLENVHQASAYRLAIVVLLIAALVLNAIFICFWAVDRIAHRDGKNLSKMPWIVTNGIIALMIIVTLFTYAFGFLERRDHNLNKKLQETTVSQEVAETQETTGSQKIDETQELTDVYTKTPAED